MKKTAQLKDKALWISFIIYLSTVVYEAHSQSPGDKFANKNCEYIHFVNDTLIEFMIDGSYQGSTSTIYHGTGQYKIKDSQLTIYVHNYNTDSLIDRKRFDVMCSNFENRVSGVDKYKIIITSSETISLIGPITKNHQKLNNQRFMKSFLNWPWKWSFKKQHWYDPRERKLQKLE